MMVIGAPLQGGGSHDGGCSSSYLSVSLSAYVYVLNGVSYHNYHIVTIVTAIMFVCL